MADTKRTISFSVGGRMYKVVTSASEQEILHLAGIVDERMKSMAGSRPPTLEVAVLTAVSLAHDAEAHRKRADEIAAGARNVVGRMLDRIDAALEKDPATKGKDEV
jgi:cell division protein ZapA (FtsZ GTPase activity inhibitor)